MSKVLNNFTSTGKKFWCWPKQMKDYRLGKPDTIISTHVSPEGSCNLNCSYCSVSNRTKWGRIPLPVIKAYIETLMKHGLKAVIITGGGEPLLYPYIDELMFFLKNRRLKVGLITNGTMSRCLTDYSWGKFSWVRVSLSVFDDWEKRVAIPTKALAEDCVVGCSFVWTDEEKETFDKVSRVARRINAQYIRLLPNCLQSDKDLESAHERLGEVTRQLRRKDKRYFHQWKSHRVPDEKVCHQSYFRPYLSEEPFWKNDLSGSVYPCDSVVLNDAAAKFRKKYQICYALNIEKFLARKVKPHFDPKEDCKGCVFTDTVEMLGEWKRGRIKEQRVRNLIHKEFV